jgi:galactokinase
MKIRELRERFRSLYRAETRIYRAPGRVNLIGEHTDYNDGFVMPMAINFSTWVALAPRRDRKIVMRSENFAETFEFDLDQTDARATGHWSDYPRGVALTLESAGVRLSGADILINGEVPLGSGLSSSAAIEVATGYALMNLAGVDLGLMQLARACQRAENEFVGMRCGLMDQFISCFGAAGQALMLDCRSLAYRALPVPETEVKVVVCNTMVRHELAGSEYNVRRAECEEGVRLLAQELPRVQALRDVTMADLERFRPRLPEVIYRRCRHIVSENDRVIESAAALDCGDLSAFGRLMDQSHRSLRDDYEVSCAELDVMVELARGAEGVYGARMTGGGFGGCTVNLVASQNVDAFKQTVALGYFQATGREPNIYVCTASQGVQPVESDAGF